MVSTPRGSPRSPERAIDQVTEAKALIYIKCDLSTLTDFRASKDLLRDTCHTNSVHEINLVQMLGNGRGVEKMVPSEHGQGMFLLLTMNSKQLTLLRTFCKYLVVG